MHRVRGPLSARDAEYGGLVKEQGVVSLPTVKVYRGGRVVDTLPSAESEPNLRRFIDKHVTRAADPLQLAALKAYEQGRLDHAASLAAQSALDDPDHPRTAANVVKLLMQQGRHRQAHELLSALPARLREDREAATLFAHLGFILAAEDAPRADDLRAAIAADPDDLDARFRLSAVSLLADDYDTALAQLLELARRDRRFGDDAGRRGLLALFTLLGPDDPRVREYQALLQAAVH